MGLLVELVFLAIYIPLLCITFIKCDLVKGWHRGILIEAL
jgi:hypothetical protein